MSFEHSPFAKQLYEAGTPKKGSPSNGGQRSYQSPNTSLLKESLRRRSSGRFNTSGDISSFLMDSTPSKKLGTNIVDLNYSRPSGGNTSSFSSVNRSGNQSAAAADSSWFNPERSYLSSVNTTGVNTTKDYLGPNSSASLHTPAKQMLASFSSANNSQTSMLADSSFASSRRISANATLANGSPLGVPPNVYTTSQSEKPPKGAWFHPAMDEVLSRRVDKEQCVWHIIYHICGLLILMTVRTILASFDWVDIFDDKPFVFTAINTAVWIKRILLCFIALNVGVATYKLAKPMDKCEDIPLTQEQRRLLGLPPSPKAVPKSTHTPPQYPKSNGSSPLSSVVRTSSFLARDGGSPQLPSSPDTSSRKLDISNLFADRKVFDSVLSADSTSAPSTPVTAKPATSKPNSGATSANISFSSPTGSIVSGHLRPTNATSTPVTGTPVSGESRATVSPATQPASGSTTHTPPVTAPASASAAFRSPFSAPLHSPRHSPLRSPLSAPLHSPNHTSPLHASPTAANTSVYSNTSETTRVAPVSESERARVANMIEEVLEKHADALGDSTKSTKRRFKYIASNRGSVSSLTESSSGRPSLPGTPTVASPTSNLDMSGSHNMFRYHQRQLDDMPYNVRL